jgi:hypothetical protein
MTLSQDAVEPCRRVYVGTYKLMITQIVEMLVFSWVTALFRVPVGESRLLLQVLVPTYQTAWCHNQEDHTATKSLSLTCKC